MPRPKKNAKPETPEDVGQIVRSWTASPCIYGWDSRERRDNPDFHPPVHLTHLGLFIDDAGQVIPQDALPPGILEEAKGTSLDITYRRPETRTGSLRDAMLGAGVQDTDPDDDARRASRPMIFG